MKTVFNNQQLCHVWASRSQESGRNPSKTFYFKDDTIWSYGSHYVAAKIYDSTVLINSRGYSNTTRKQLNNIRRAVTQYKTYTVPDVLTPDSLDNHNHFVNRIVGLIDSILKNTISKYDTDMIGDITDTILEYRNYCQKFNLKPDSDLDRLLGCEFYKDLLFINNIKLQKSFQKSQAAILKCDEKNKEIINRTHNNLHLWLSNTEHDLKPKNDDVQLLADYSGHDYCRVLNNNVQTQRYAIVSIDEARQALDLIERVGADRLIGSRIGSFKVESHNDGILTIGCHKIKIQQVKEVLK